MAETDDRRRTLSSALDTVRYARALNLFEELIDLDPPNRDTRLRTLRANEPDLAEVVTRLLTADAEPDTRLDQTASAVDEDHAAHLVGTRLGAWHIIDVIGRGGMGVVFRADRADGQFEQTCALKLIGIGLGHAGARQRFLRERQILARFKHDNIATLIDGGVTDRHEPWFAMELVEGTPITHWCDEHELGLRARVMLFQQVLDAVRYAHSQLVVHRDLKPSNILVTQSGRVKLLDFGVAKLLEEQPVADGQTIDIALTPEYAAPEQILGENIGPAADIYALGVLLYTLLSGQNPFTEMARGQALFRKRLAGKRVEIESLATVAGRLPADVTQQRRLRPAALRRALRGGLAAIVHRCLNDDPAHRYISVDGMADDLNRWLENRPVLAYKGQWRYRATQFIKRNRVPLASAAVIAVFVIGFIVYRGIQLAETRYERDLYTRTFNFVTDVLARATSSDSGRDMTVREALNLMLDEMDRRDLPADARSWLTSMIADVKVNANDPQAAAAAIEEELDTSAGASGLVQSRLLEGQAMALEMAGKHAAAIESLDRALALVERERVDDIQVAAQSRLLTTKVRFGIRQRLVPLDQARALAERAIALGDPERTGPHTSIEDLAQAYIALVDVHILSREYEKARDTLATVESILDDAELLGNDMLLDAFLAAQHLILGDTAQAAGSLERLIEQWTNVYGPNFRSVASLTAQYAEALERLGRVDEAIEASERARRIIRTDDTQSMDVLNLDTLIARRLLRTGDYARAWTYAENLGETLAGREDAGARSALAQTWILRAETSLLEQHPERTAALLDSAQAVLATLSADEVGATRAQRSFERVSAEYCLTNGDFACAERHGRQARELTVSVLDDPHEVLLADRAYALALLGQPDRADSGRRILEETGRTASRLFGDCNPFARIMARTQPALGSKALLAEASADCPAPK